MTTRTTFWSCAAIVLACSLLLGLSGCATPTQPANMAAAAPVQVQNRSSGSVMVSVSGGSETSSAGWSNISNDDFAAAIRRSLSESKEFGSIATSLPADYRIDVMIVRLDRPMFGASFTVSIETSWRLTRESDHAVVWEKSIVSSYTASMSDAFVGATRLRMALEGAARVNITDAISKIGQLPLK